MRKMKRIYADTAAGMDNPSSLHSEGLAAAKALAAARARVAELIGAHPDEIIFTSGGTEANNLAIKGILSPMSNSQFLISNSEHPSVSEVASHQTVTAEPEAVRKALNPKIKLVSIAYADGVIGTINPIREIAKIIRNFKAKTLNAKQLSSYPLFHTDACQAPRFLDINVARLGVDLMTLNSSKIYGPKGVGCLYVRRGIKLNPILFGGGQERGLRSGTENVPAIVGFADALEQCAKLRDSESARLTKLRDELITGLLKIKGAKLNGDLIQRLPNNVNVALPLLEPEQWVIELDAKGIACSAGSACSSNKIDAHDIIGVRFSLGRNITKAEINYIVKAVLLIFKKYCIIE